MFAPYQNDDVRDNGHTLKNDCERNEKSNRAPHGTEITVPVTVFFLREVFAGVGERGTAAVETIGVVNLFAARLIGENLVRCRGDVEEGRRRTVSLSQLIHLGVIMLVRVKAKAVKVSVSGTCPAQWLNGHLPAKKTIRAPP